MSLEILDVSKQEMNKLRNNNSPKENYPDYLFNIMKGDKQRKDEAIYRNTSLHSAGLIINWKAFQENYA